MTAVAELVSQHFSVMDGELCIGGLSASSIASQFGTPLFVYDAGIMEAQLKRLRAALPDRFEIYYSVKANPNVAVLRHFLALGCGLEIASAGEYHAAIAAGCPTTKIIFAGPGKTEQELELVLAKGIGEIHVESSVELDRIVRLSQRLGVRATVALRINPTGESQGGAMRMGGKAAPFGVDEELAAEMVDRMAKSPVLAFAGMHLFAGTQILDHEVLLTQYRKGVELARSLAMRMQRPLATVDFGGGLGVPYFANEQPLNLVGLREGLDALMRTIQSDPWFKGTRFLVEPGRFLVGESGIFVASVTDVKVSRGKRFVILDGGMNAHLAASGNLGQTIKRNYPIGILNKMNAVTTVTADVVGPLCTPLDTLGRTVELPQPKVGDLVGVFQSGAYGLTASPVNFLSHLSPVEVLVEQGRAQLIRARGALSAAS